MFENFAQALVSAGIKATVAQALGAYRMINPEASATPQDLYALRVKLTGNVHESLVKTALSDPIVMSYVHNHKKIQAIKELRVLTDCGLKEAKDGIEDNRVWGSVAHPNNY